MKKRSAKLARDKHQQEATNKKIKKEDNANSNQIN